MVKTKQNKTKKLYIINCYKITPYHSVLKTMNETKMKTNSIIHVVK